MSFAKEFKEFAMRGNVIDLAVGVIIGGAFGKIVSSFVGDVVMPALGKIVGGVDFSNLALNLGASADGKSEILIRYGAFLQTIFDFLIIALAIFLAIKALNRLKRPDPAAPPPPSPQEVLLTEIRDLLKKG
ncbi:MAG: large-conductance mechanosensitive channel protein MscL [Steroidobacteraceae bacterium]|nr:large-conductance mechanosensitive channel protein MscL [Steroidobacteraceae bacterium]MDW8258571.1 large-conductance mechanosensitive channel protein MscL [Gammaproteobacteria bacterium]